MFGQDFQIEVVTVESPLRDAARLAAESLTMADRANGVARLAISGALPEEFLLQLRLRLAGNDADASPSNVWTRTSMTWIDEVCVPASDLRSKRGAVVRSGVLATKYRLGYELPLQLDGEEPHQAIARFALHFAEHFAGGLDVAVIDLGTALTLATPTDPRSVVQRSTSGDGTERLALSAQIVADAPLLVVIAYGRSATEALGLLRARSVDVRRRGPGTIYVVSDTPPRELRVDDTLPSVRLASAGK